MARLWFRIAAAVALAVVSAAGPAAQSKGQPVFTKEQAEAGRAQYATTCARCHSGDLGGNSEAPALAGPGFMASWGSQTTLDLFKYVQGMPPDGDRLDVDEYLAVVAFILAQNSASAGAQPITASTEVRIDTIATGETPAAGGH